MLTKCPNEFGTASYRQMLKQGDSPVSGALWHFFRADELRQAAESCGLTTLEMVGCEGISTGLAEATNASRQNETTWHAWMDVLLDTSTDPAVVDMAEHIVYFGSK
jgi:hypothetical protein